MLIGQIHEAMVVVVVVTTVVVVTVAWGAKVEVVFRFCISHLSGVRKCKLGNKNKHIFVLSQQ